MAVLQMQRISICALKKERKAVLEYIQSKGVIEIDHILEEDEDFKKMDTVSSRVNFEKAANIADQALEILQQYAPQKQSMLSGLAGKELVEQSAYGHAVSNREEIYRTALQMVTLNKTIAEHKGCILKLENSIESLTPWLTLDVPMNYKGTTSTTMYIGTMPGVQTMQDLYGVIAENAPDVTGADIQIISADKDTTYLTVMCLTSEASQVEEALRVRGFAKPSQIAERTPARVKESYESEIEELNRKIAGIEGEIRETAVRREDFRLIADYYRVRADKYEVLGTLPQSKRTFLISGYAPTRSLEELRRVLTDKYECVVDVEDIKEDEQPPIVLSNNHFSESAEPILESYGLPHKGELDPTTIMSFFYVFFFGLMLSDAAYGAIVAIACGILLKKFPRMGSMRKSIQLFFWCGLSTLFWGIMFGGYFGDVVNVVSRTFFGHEVGIKAVWFVPLDNPMRLLIYSMLFGTIHLFVGLGIKGYMEIKDKKYLDFFCDVVIWYVFLIGLLLMLIPSDIFASIAQATIVFPPAVALLAKVMAIGGALGLLLMSGRSSKNWGLRIALGAYDIYQVTGWLSDVLSYSRLLALGLATGVIASVVNQMGSMLGNGIVGIIGFIIIFLGGHTFNIAINLLGAYVHTNRLQYVEFFGKFYEGGGRAFNPFKANTKYVDFKEETNQ